MKIALKLTFPAQYLINYLKSVQRFNKLEHEILAILTYQKAYEEIFGVSTMIAFPLNPHKERELKMEGFIPAKNLGKFIATYAEENSPIDAVIVEGVEKNSLINPLQIKYLGKGKYKNVDTDKTISFLKKYISYEKNQYSLLLVLDGKTNVINLRKVVDWLVDNDFPFSEVILIQSGLKSKKIIFYQLKPFKDKILSLEIDGKEFTAK